MKRFKPWYWLGATLVYSYLFYHQSAGINFLIFNILLVISVFVLQPELRTRRATVVLAVGCLLTATVIAWHATWAAILMNLASLMGLSGLSRQTADSLVVAWVHSAYSSALLTSFSLDFISVWWIIFTLVGAYLLGVFYYPLTIRSLARADLASPNQLIRRRRSPSVGFNPVSLRYEYRSGWLLFVLLNVLLLFFNAVDTFYLTTLRLPAGVTYAMFLHQGVNALIASVVLAIAVVMYFFRGNLNFLTQNHRLRYAAYLWIIQNALLVMLTAVKNFSYVDQYGLTHKRIGVYLYLLLTLIGLITTYVKVHDIKSNWFLFRRNAWIFYAVLVVFSFFDWSRVITHYNLTYLDETQIDVNYLIGLSDTNLDLLDQARRQYDLSLDQESLIQRYIDYFIERTSRQDWQSWNYSDHQRYQRLRLAQLSSPFQ